MALVAGDWSIDRATGNIRYIGGNHTTSPTYATVIEFHRWLGDLADDASSVGDDELDITDELPSTRSTDNIIFLLGNYNIDATASEHLYDGSIIQGTGVTEVIYDGIVNYGNSNVQIQIIQNGAVLATPYWNQSSAGINADATQGISHRWLIKTKTAGADIDNRKLIATTRVFGKTYNEFIINATSNGNNVLALTNSDDRNNTTVEGTVSGWTTITNTTEGFAQLDVDGNGSTEDYYSEWNKAALSINDFYERMKWLTRDGSVSTIYGLNGELFRGITHEIDIDTNTGTFAAFEAVSWTGGTGQMLAINSVTAGTKMWIQLLTGVAPTDGQVITGASTASAVVNTTVTDRSALISKPFIGASTGSAIIGAYGVGLKTTDVVITDKLFDLTNTQLIPPHFVTFSVNNLDGVNDRLILGPWDGSSVDINGDPEIEFNQLTTTASIINSATVTSIPVTITIPTDTPASGSLRVLSNAGSYIYVEYSSYSGSTFTIPSFDFSSNVINASSNLFISYLDKTASAISESFTTVYSSDRDLVLTVRNGGNTPIKQFTTSAILGSNSSSLTTIRTSDA